MARAIQLVGVDCGSTTTSLVTARARLVTTALGRVEIVDVEPTYQSELVFTPFERGQLDAAQFGKYLDQWLAEAGLTDEEIFGGGALVTGLAAETANADAVTHWIEARLAGAVIALAGDPRLEAWLAFMGNCHALSKADPVTPLVNLDIGGGTTNIAFGHAGQVDATGSLLVGARHLQFTPGTYQLRALSPHGDKLLEHLEIALRPGDTLSRQQIEQICDAFVDLIVAAIDGNDAVFQSAIGRALLQAPCSALVPNPQAARITLSGGVGRLAYQLLSNGVDPRVTEFGDLGGELAARLIERPAIEQRLLPARPEALGRATVFGLVRYSTELSGTTLYLPHPELLPLANVPIVGRIDSSTTDEQLANVLELIAGCHPAGCMQVELDSHDLAAIQSFAERLNHHLARRPLCAGQTLVLLTAANLGKLLGSYITQWGTRGPQLVVIDEVPLRDAQFVRLGRLHDGLVPLWLHAVR